jgi:hypothetical protein
MEPDPLLPSGSSKVVSIVIPSSPGTYRVFVMCQRHYPEHWASGARWVIDAFVLKQAVMDRIYSKEFQR